jgi:hypothetical protein
MLNNVDAPVEEHRHTSNATLMLNYDIKKTKTKSKQQLT